jgi:hypothetical protein
MGRSDLFLKLEIIKKSYGMAFLIATMWFGPMVMAYSLLVTSVLSMIVNSWPNRKLMNYTFGEMMLDILPDAAMALVMGAIVYAITFLHLGNVITLIIQIPLGIVIYALLSKLFHIDSFEVILDFIRKRRGNEIS